MTATMDRQSAAATAVAQESILDKVDKFVEPFIDCLDEQRWAGILYSTATGIIREVPTFPRFYITANDPEAGKSLFMRMMVCLSCNPVNGSGTSFGLVSALAAASAEKEKPVPTIYRDEIGKVKIDIQLSDILREGYVAGATRSRSRNGVPEYYSIYVPFIMAGLPSGFPTDIRTRCIVVTLKPGHPKRYFDLRDSQRDAYAWGRELTRQARAAAKQVNEFRVLNLGIPELVGRKAEVWEPLFAVAQALGGQKWVTRCLAAFKLLALAESDKPELTPEQEVLKNAAELAPILSVFGFVPGQRLGEEMRRLPRYSGRSLASMNKLISESIPFYTQQRRLPETGERMRGYELDEILRAWEMVRPRDVEDMEEFLEDDPFAVDFSEDSSYIMPGGTGGTGGTGKTAQPAAQPPAPEAASAPQPVAPGAPVAGVGWVGADSGVEGS
jgi:hypothetical protein